mgnify:CR=1 FL=1
MADTAATTDTMETKPKPKKSCLDVVHSPSFLIYVNFLCSSWGDWMWLFAGGLYLVHLDEGRLRLAAGFGFAGGSCVLLFGGLIGEWVDRHPRLYVVRVALFIQNACVMLSAACVGVSLHLEAIAHPLWAGPLRHALEAAIISTAILAQLASIAYKISIEKDWVVVVARGNKSTLANLNAVIRAIDLLAKVLAPTCVGLVMTYASLMTSAIVIASWNAVSVFLEYGMLLIVYRRVPALADKTLRTAPPGAAPSKEMVEIKSKPEEEEPMHTGIAVGEEPKDQSEAVSVHDEACPGQNGTVLMDTEKQPLNGAALPVKVEEPVNKEEGEEKARGGCCGCVHTMFGPLVMLVQGWKTYARQKVVYAGLALATLYMTVMGFDSVTCGYIYSAGGPQITEWVVGISMALAGVTGIASTFLFTRLRRKVGLERTGLISFNLEILCLTLAVASVWAPGSPFDVHFASRPDNCTAVRANETGATSQVQAGFYRFDESKLEGEGKANGSRTRRDLTSVDHLGDLDLLFRMVSLEPVSMRHRRSLGEVHEEPQLSVAGAQQGGAAGNVTCQEAGEYEGVNISIILFLIGIITSRTGLWMADLVVTQLLQETVAETERGVVNGVQNSLNMLMEMTKFVLVIVAPHVETFGILIIISFLFICLAGVLFATHSYRVRGHLFHFERCLCYTPHLGSATRRAQDAAIFRQPAAPQRV